MRDDGRRRTIDLVIGYGSVALFVLSIGVLFWFLAWGVDRPEAFSEALDRGLRRATEGRGDARATFNVLIVLAWGVLHALSARPRVRERFRRVVPPHLDSAVYSGVAAVGLIAVCLLYRPMAWPVWKLAAGPALLARLVFCAGWGLLAYCFAHVDLLEVTGLRPILRHHDGTQAAPAPFRPTGPFLWVRHPVELALLIAYWAAPTMTSGHLLFALLMTVYTCVSIDLEDRRMLEIQGAAYLEYVKRVPQILPLPR